MKVLRMIKKIISAILIFIFLVFAIAMSVLLLNYNEYGLTQFGDTTFVIINSDLYSKNYDKGDLVLVQSTKLDNIKKNDELFTYRVKNNGKVEIDLGTVEKIHDEEKAISFKNGDTYSMDFVIGKEKAMYDNVGTYLSIIESKWGFFFMILIPCFIFFLWGVYALIIEIKYGDQDDDDEEYEEYKRKKLNDNIEETKSNVEIKSDDKKETEQNSEKKDDKDAKEVNPEKDKKEK